VTLDSRQILHASQSQAVGMHVLIQQAAPMSERWLIAVQLADGRSGRTYDSLARWNLLASDPWIQVRTRGLTGSKPREVHTSYSPDGS